MCDAKMCRQSNVVLQYWDYTANLDLESVEKSCYILLGGSVFLTLLIMMSSNKKKVPKTHKVEA